MTPLWTCLWSDGGLQGKQNHSNPLQLGSNYKKIWLINSQKPRFFLFIYLIFIAEALSKWVNILDTSTFPISSEAHKKGAIFLN